jgi:hypothetical protein
VRRSIVQQPDGDIVGFGGGLRLSGSDRAEGNEHGRVDSERIVQKGADNTLDEGDILGVKRR